jgi:putative addiction module CopG family antidote
MVEKLSITITDEQARRIREKVEVGEFASASEVVRSALSLLQDSEDAESERRIVSVRRRVEASLENPVRHSSEDMRRHIDDLVRDAAGTRARKRQR